MFKPYLAAWGSFVSASTLSLWTSTSSRSPSSMSLVSVTSPQGLPPQPIPPSSHVACRQASSRHIVQAQRPHWTAICLHPTFPWQSLSWSGESCGCPSHGVPVGSVGVSSQPERTASSRRTAKDPKKSLLRMGFP